jgi:acyl dehydratase
MLKINQKFTFEDGPITRDLIKKYAKLNNSVNLIHINDEYAEKVGLKGVIAHGMLVYAYFIKHVNNLAEKNNGILINTRSEIRGMVRPGDWIITSIHVKSITDKIVNFYVEVDSKMPLELLKNGNIIQTFEGKEKGWVKEKEKSGIGTEEIPEGVLTFRQWRAIRGTAQIQLN